MKTYKHTNKTLSGKKFYHLSFVKIVERKPKVLICKWKCDCGNEVVSNFYAIRRGNKKTCGCYLTMKKENNPKWTGVGEMPGKFWNVLTFRAKNRNLELNITKEYLWKLFLKQNRKCALTGEPLKFCSGWSSHNGTASVDRIDSNKGYIKGNVQWVHQDVNFMKQDFSMDYFLELCRKVCRYTSKN
jgi:hypothetical protein